MHGCALAEDLGISSIIVPAHPGVLSAAGLLGAPVAHELATAFPCSLATLNPAALTTAVAELDARCEALMRQEGVDNAETTHFADVCYIGQSYHLEVRLDTIDAAVIYDAFLAAHTRVYGHSTNVPAKIVNLRTVHQAFAGTAATHAVASPASVPPGRRTIRIGNGLMNATIWQRGSLPPNAILQGPAIFEQADSTTLVEPGWTRSASAKGDALLLERAA